MLGLIIFYLYGLLVGSFLMGAQATANNKDHYLNWAMILFWPITVLSYIMISPFYYAYAFGYSHALKMMNKTSGENTNVPS